MRDSALPYDGRRRRRSPLRHRRPPAPPCAPHCPLLRLHRRLHRHLHVSTAVHSPTNLCNPLCKHGALILSRRSILCLRSSFCLVIELLSIFGLFELYVDLLQSFGAIIFMRAWIIIIGFVVRVRGRGKGCRSDRNLRTRTGILHVWDKRGPRT